ncbi:MAG: DEAD/DEAH box helicase [Planctomycetota bacterium]|nr:MAG: DEAD/DEAH box helicase [Planctomycetota bacterium]
MSVATPVAAQGFCDLGLPDTIMATLDRLGYVEPSPIQAQAIPPLLAGQDVLGQAQTGTGKTAAFALPLLARLDPAQRHPQILVLTPTRELAGQVAESWQRYGAGIGGIKVACLYGGSSYVPQLKALSSGAQIVVGTPGRIIDHLNRGTLDTSRLQALVLDEADEMLRMGFIDDVQRIAEACPEQRQTALFSATMPPPIRRLTHRHLRNPVEITIATDHSVKALIRQRAAVVPFRNKTDALLRLLAMETYDGIIVFVATRVATNDVTQALLDHGYRAAQLSGDVAQRDREITVDRFIKGRVDILVATDVAARGLDVDRVSHVINYDLPNDLEQYTHRIGRTGRAGRSGEAISFAAPHQRHFLAAVERRSGSSIERWEIPSAKDVNNRRLERIGEQIVAASSKQQGLDGYRTLISDLIAAGNDPVELAACLAREIHGDAEPFHDRKGPIGKAPGKQLAGKGVSKAPPSGKRPSKGLGAHPGPSNGGRQLCQFSVGRRHGATPARMLAAIANASGLSGKAIGRIAIDQDHSTVDMPSDLPAGAWKALRKQRINGQPLV